MLCTGAIHAIMPTLCSPLSRLKLEDCIPDVELKQKIDAWITEGQQQGMKGSLAEDTPMEVDDL